MKKLLTTIAVLAVFTAAGAAFATPDWAGNVWPLDGSSHTPTAGIQVYAQVYQAGVTDAAGQGAGITGEFYYASSIDGVYHTLPMTYNGDVGNNDEYTATVPQAALIGSASVDVNVIFFDDNDGTWIYVSGDQNGTPPPLTYNIVDVLPVDVTVRFTVCMSMASTTGNVCVIGSAAEIGAWGTGVDMTSIGSELWQVDVVFPAGSAPAFDYKYKKDACATWESVGNRSVVLPTDGSTLVELATDGWDNQDVDCQPVDVEGSSWGTVKSLYR